MPIEFQILLAFVIDLALGDPRWLPHPVRWLGATALRVEAVTRRYVRPPRTAGLVAAALLIAGCGLSAHAALSLAQRVDPRLADALSIYLIYTTIATRDLMDHSRAVFKRLMAGNLPAARTAVGRIVGRDTHELDEAGVTRAAVETVAESLVDGITAPLLFAFLFGPVGAVCYRTINTLDSIFGYKNERYREFGWAAARIDDLANWAPARLTAPLIALAATVLGQRGYNALAILRRDRACHPSPNAGLSEAAVAGALGVQLGGVNRYFGEPHERPQLGDPIEPLEPAHIRQANQLILVSTLFFLALGIACRVILGGAS